MVQKETIIKIEYQDLLGDSFDEDTSEKEMEELIEEHIIDYCKEHKINRSNVKIL